MSSDPLENRSASESKPTVVNDELSNQNIEMNQPLAKVSTSSNSDSYTDIDDSTSDDDDDDEKFPIDLTFDSFEEQMRAGNDLRPLLSRMIEGLPNDIPQSTVYEILMNIFLPIRQRKQLEQYQTLDDAVELIRTCKNILVLTGAGISVSCGIPDFRSRDGIYARLHVEFPELPDPQAMFDIEYFTRDPRPFFRFAKEIWPGQYQPSLAHHFIAELERQNKLLRNYTQNIDSLEHLCPITRLIQCHGSFSTATCRLCHTTVQSDEIKDEILQQKIPNCRKCPNDAPNAILKPDIVFFGEQLPDDFHKTIITDKTQCDLLIVMGSSLKVKPVSLVSELLPSHIPQILINREHLSHKSFDIELLGNCDVILNEICLRLEKTTPEFGKLNLISRKCLNEIPYDVSSESKRKKQKLSSENENQSSELIEPDTTSIPINQDSTYISYPPRRYIFSGAEIDFSSDEESSDDEELPRKNNE